MQKAIILSIFIARCSGFYHVSPTQTGMKVYSMSEADSDPAGSFRYDNSDSISPLEKKRALQDTKNWCLDRCIQLGHCEVLEDLNKMTTAQVQDFCKACIIEGESTPDECDISFMFTPDGPWGKVEPPAEVAKLSK